MSDSRVKELEEQVAELTKRQEETERLVNAIFKAADLMFNYSHGIYENKFKAIVKRISNES